MNMQVTIAKGLFLKLGYAILRNCTVTQSSDVRQLFGMTVAAVKQKYEGKDIAEDTTVAGIRALFHSVGIDPTRYRPSGEALVRRALKGQELYHVNSVVDINNICSMETLFPFGSYDADQIKGNVVLRLGKEVETYKGITKDIDITGKLTTADDLGAFGSPIADSDRTKITDKTKSLLVIIYAPTVTDTKVIEKAIDQYVAFVETFTGGKSEIKSIIET